MSIIRYNSNDYVPTAFSSLLDKFFNESLARSGGSTFVPKVDIVENNDTYEIQMAVPGLTKEDFKIELNDNYLTVSGERKFSNEKQGMDSWSLSTNCWSITP